MERIQRFLTSPIGRKVMMALTGLFLIMFLVVHLAGNFQLLQGGGGLDFNNYARLLTSTSLIYVAEAGLVALFVYHLINGLLVQLRNWRATPTGYQVRSTAGHTTRASVASRTMIWTGSVVVLFVIIHVATMKYRVAGDDTITLYALVVYWFKQPIVVALYTLCLALLGFHLWHGFGSAFETLGVRHSKALRRTGQLIALAITVGFLVIPVVMFMTLGK